jgi:hypothetical protein
VPACRDREKRGGQDAGGETCAGHRVATISLPAGCQTAEGRAQIDFQRFTEDSEAEVQDLQQQLMGAFTAKLFPIIGQVATERNLWAVFNLSESGIIWQNPAFDLSEEIAKRLDASAKPK